MAFFGGGPYIFKRLGGAGEGQHTFRMNGEEEEARKCQHRKEMVKMSSHQDHRARASRSQTRDFIFVFPAQIICMLFSPPLLPFSIYCCSFTEAKNKGMLWGFFNFILQIGCVNFILADSSHLWLCYFQR